MKTAYDLTIAPVVVDIDDDGIPEVLVAAGASCLCLSTTLGLRWQVDQHSSPSSDFRISGIAVADINNDDSPEVIFAGGHMASARQSGLFVLDGTGAVLAFRPLLTGPALAGAPVICDIDGDGWKEVLVLDTHGSLHCCRWSGETLVLAWSRVAWSRVVSGYVLNASPCLLDINGDGVREILVSLEEGKILALSGVDGSSVASIEHGYSSAIGGTPTGGDLDGDGRVEVLVPLLQAGRLLCFRVGAMTTGNWFRRWGFSAGRTGEVSDVDGG